MPHIAGHVSIPSGFNLAGQPPLTGFPQGSPIAPRPTGGGIPPTGLIGAEQALLGSTQGALQALGGGIGAAQGELDIGNIGLENQAALAGLRGQEAQSTAFQGFRESPGQAFLREQGEQALIRNQGAIGGLGGGNVRRELQRQGIGLAAQDFGNQFQRGQQVLGSQQQSAQGLANLSAQGGISAAQLLRGTGQDVAGQRFVTGQQLAQAATGTASNLSNLQQSLGIDLSNLTGQTSTNLANILSGTGQATSQAQQQLATLLANIGVGGASGAAGFTSLAGQFDQLQSQQQSQAAQNAITSLIDLGVFDTSSGSNINQQLANEQGIITPA